MKYKSMGRWISVNGPMNNYETPSDNSWYYDRLTIETIIIEENVTTIGNHAIYSCSKLTNIIIPIINLLEFYLI